MRANTSNIFKQYTIRNIPLPVDQYLRKRAKETGKSFNQMVVDTLIKGTGEKASQRTDLDFLIGSMTKREAMAIEDAIQGARKIDNELWKT